MNQEIIDQVSKRNNNDLNSLINNNDIQNNNKNENLNTLNNKNSIKHTIDNNSSNNNNQKAFTLVNKDSFNQHPSNINSNAYSNNSEYNSYCSNQFLMYTGNNDISNNSIFNNFIYCNNNNLNNNEINNNYLYNIDWVEDSQLNNAPLINTVEQQLNYQEYYYNYLNQIINANQYDSNNQFTSNYQNINTYNNNFNNDTTHSNINNTDYSCNNINNYHTNSNNNNIICYDNNGSILENYNINNIDTSIYSSINQQETNSKIDIFNNINTANNNDTPTNNNNLNTDNYLNNFFPYYSKKYQSETQISKDKEKEKLNSKLREIINSISSDNSIKKSMLNIVFSVDFYFSPKTYSIIPLEFSSHIEYKRIWIENFLYELKHVINSSMNEEYLVERVIKISETEKYNESLEISKLFASKSSRKYNNRDNRKNNNYYNNDEFSFMNNDLLMFSTDKFFLSKLNDLNKDSLCYLLNKKSDLRYGKNSSKFNSNDMEYNNPRTKKDYLSLSKIIQEFEDKVFFGCVLIEDYSMRVITLKGTIDKFFNKNTNEVSNNNKTSIASNSNNNNDLSLKEERDSSFYNHNTNNRKENSADIGDKENIGDTINTGIKINFIKRRDQSKLQFSTQSENKEENNTYNKQESKFIRLYNKFLISFIFFINNTITVFYCRMLTNLSTSIREFDSIVRVESDFKFLNINSLNKNCFGIDILEKPVINSSIISSNQDLDTKDINMNQDKNNMNINYLNKIESFNRFKKLREKINTALMLNESQKSSIEFATNFMLSNSELKEVINENLSILEKPNIYNDIANKHNNNDVKDKRRLENEFISPNPVTHVSRLHDNNENSNECYINMNNINNIDTNISLITKYNASNINNTNNTNTYFNINNINTTSYSQSNINSSNIPKNKSLKYYNSLFTKQIENEEEKNNYYNIKKDESLKKIKQLYKEKSFLLVQGPPGTGKTQTIIALVTNLLIKDPQSRILICAPSNNAIDEIAVRLYLFLISEGLKYLRLKKQDLIRFSANEKLIYKDVYDFTQDRKYLEEVYLESLLQRNLNAKYESNNTNVERLIREQELQFSVASNNEKISIKNNISNLKSMKYDSRNSKEKYFIEKEIIDECKIVCTTLNSAGHIKLSKKQFDYVFIDECSQSVEPSCLIALEKGRNVILFGDQMQLPPTVFNDKCEYTLYNRSLFERLLRICHEHRNEEKNKNNGNNAIVENKIVNDNRKNRGNSEINYNQSQSVVNKKDKENNNNFNTMFSEVVLIKNQSNTKEFNYDLEANREILDKTNIPNNTNTSKAHNNINNINNDNIEISLNTKYKEFINKDIQNKNNTSSCHYNINNINTLKTIIYNDSEFNYSSINSYPSSNININKKYYNRVDFILISKSVSLKDSVFLLEYQYRMSESILNFISNTFYNGKVINGRDNNNPNNTKSSKNTNNKDSVLDSLLDFLLSHVQSNFCFFNYNSKFPYKHIPKHKCVFNILNNKKSTQQYTDTLNKEKSESNKIRNNAFNNSLTESIINTNTPINKEEDDNEIFKKNVYNKKDRTYTIGSLKLPLRVLNCCFSLYHKALCEGAHGNNKGYEEVSGFSYYNKTEVFLIIELIHFIVQLLVQSYKKMSNLNSNNNNNNMTDNSEYSNKSNLPKQTLRIGVISFYKEQSHLIREEIRQLNMLKFNINEKVRVEIDINTVDSFQGKEKDIVILSCVRSNNSNSIGFLNELKRLNVAISRAKTFCFIVGDLYNMSMSKNAFWEMLINYLIHNESVFNCFDYDLEIKNDFNHTGNRVISKDVLDKYLSEKDSDVNENIQLSKSIKSTIKQETERKMNNANSNSSNSHNKTFTHKELKEKERAHVSNYSSVLNVHSDVDYLNSKRNNLNEEEDSLRRKFIMFLRNKFFLRFGKINDV